MSIGTMVMPTSASAERGFKKIQLGRIESQRPLQELVADSRVANTFGEDAKFLINDVHPDSFHFNQHFTLCYVRDFFSGVNPVLQELEARVRDQGMLCPAFAAPYLLPAISEQEGEEEIRGDSILVVSHRIQFEGFPHMMRIARKNRSSPWRVAIYRIENPLMKIVRDCPIIVATPE